MEPWGAAGGAREEGFWLLLRKTYGLLSQPWKATPTSLQTGAQAAPLALMGLGQGGSCWGKGPESLSRGEGTYLGGDEGAREACS